MGISVVNFALVVTPVAADMIKKTQTSSFGSGKREAHDASPFYERNLFSGELPIQVSTPEIKPPLEASTGDWMDTIYCQSAESLAPIPDQSIGLAFTSPPYNVGKEYDGDLSLPDYLRTIETVGKEVLRVLRPGGRYVINIANLGRKPYIPLHTFFYEVHLRIGFLPMGEIIWRKGKGASGNCAWGSWMNAKAPRLRDIHEYLLVFSKAAYSRPDKGDSSITRDEFLEATLSVWEIPAESARRVGHPAPFPLALARRVIELYSYVGDVVLDPFAGSGSTCVAALQTRRHYVGFDTVPDYCDLARKRLADPPKL